MLSPATPASPDQVSHHYDELDPVYRSVWGTHLHHGYWQTGRETRERAIERLIEVVAKRAKLQKGNSVIDIGCGYGETARFLADRYDCQVTGITLSTRQWEHAQQSLETKPNQHLQFIRGNWLVNDLKADSFDHAIAIESAAHMEDKERFFAEIARVLKPGGRAVVCAWLSSHRYPAWQKRWLLEPICREGRLPSLGSSQDYMAMIHGAGLTCAHFEDASERVKRTWPQAAKGLVQEVATDRNTRRMALSRATRNRDFSWSLLRLWAAFEVGCFRYGIFTLRKG